MNIEKARFNMIEQQIKPWMVYDEKLLGAMATIPREQFVPESQRSIAYADTEIQLGHNQQMLTPREIARLLQALELQGNEKVLEIGCGSGYACALLSKLARKVHAVDIIGEFVTAAQKRLKKLAFNNVTLEEADGADGWQANAPYDAVLITSLLPELPDGVKRSLRENGRVVAILGSEDKQTATLCWLDEQDQWQYQALFPVRAIPMINAEQPDRFVF